MSTICDIRVGFAFLGLLGSTPALAAPLSFAPGHIYTTNYFSTDITQHSTTGQLLNTVTIQGLGPGEETKGLGFGPDGKLYVVLDSLFDGARLVSVDENGQIASSYGLPVATGGNLSYGKLAFGADGTVYVGTGAGVVKVEIDAADSARLLGDGMLEAFDVAVLPGGKLLQLTGYHLYETGADGELLREIPLSDPNGVSDANSFSVNDMRGLEYDPASDRIFVSMLGNSDNLFFVTMIFELATGVLLDIDHFIYGDDLSLAGHSLLLGSRSVAPWMLSPADLSIVGRLEGTERMFVTRNGLPIQAAEPGSAQMLSAGLLLMMMSSGFRFRRGRRRSIVSCPPGRH